MLIYILGVYISQNKLFIFYIKVLLDTWSWSSMLEGLSEIKVEGASGSSHLLENLYCVPTRSVAESSTCSSAEVTVHGEAHAISSIYCVYCRITLPAF